MAILNYKTLLLNADFQPFMVKSCQRAFQLVYKGVADEVDFYPNIKMRSAHAVWTVPSIIRLHKYVKARFETPNVSKHKVFIRDEYTCGFCGYTFAESQLTIDHIVPRSHKGDSSWTNLITACLKCNLKKRDRTPEQANMPLLFKPKVPSHLMLGLKTAKEIPESWNLYLQPRKKTIVYGKTASQSTREQEY